MNHATDRLSDYLDGELPAKERAVVEAHLASCPECAGTLSELRLVVQRSRELEDQPPAPDLWPLIESRLAARPVGLGARLAAWVRERGGRVSFTLPQLAGAAAALVVVTAGAMWLVMPRPMVPTPEPVSPSMRGQTGVAATFEEARYQATVAELEQVLKQHRADLDTSTVRILEENLATIDRATEQARRALLADPGNPYLHGHLAEQMRRKIWLLQRAAEVVTAQS